jgi:hypothetical protein
MRDHVAVLTRYSRVIEGWYSTTNVAFREIGDIALATL